LSNIITTILFHFQVKPTSPAARLGVASGDELLATSATVGDSMWAHSTLDSARSAVSTRFVMRSDVRVRLARRVSSIDPALLPLLKVCMQTGSQKAQCLPRRFNPSDNFFL
jgi:hypothetical protein